MMKWGPRDRILLVVVLVIALVNLALNVRDLATARRGRGPNGTRGEFMRFVGERIRPQLSPADQAELDRLLTQAEVDRQR